MSSSTVYTSTILWVVLGLVLLTHSVFFLLDQNFYAVDTQSYLAPADNLLHGRGFVNSLNQPEIARTPGYPLLLALFRINPMKVEYLIPLQHVLCVLTVVFVAGIAFKITDSSLVALGAALVLSFDFATIRVANMLLTETTFTVFIVLVCWVLYRGAMESVGAVANCAGAGLLGGCAVLVRPIGMLYFVPLSIYLFLVLKRRALRPVLAFATSFLLLPLSWCARNYLETGYFGISTVGPGNMLFYRAAGTLAVRQPGDYLTNMIRVRGMLVTQACEEMERTYGRSCSQVPEAQQAEYSARMGRNIILRDIPGYLQSALVGLGYIVFGGGAEALSQMSRISPSIAKGIVLLITVPEACLALVGCWFWFHRERSLCYLLVLTVGYFFLISAGGEAYSRFRVPVMPMYALLVGGGIALTIQLVRRIWVISTTRVTAYTSATKLHQFDVRAGNIDRRIRSCS